MGFFVLVICVILLLIVFNLDSNTAAENNKKQLENQRISQNKYLDELKVTPTKQYFYENQVHTRDIRFVVDEKKKVIVIIQTPGVPVMIRFSEIIGCEILMDSQVTGGVGRAIVGGLLAGDAGAIVGAVTTKPHITSYQIVFYKSNISSPQYTLNIISEKTKTESMDYKNAVSFANSVNSSIKAIISLTAQEKNTENEPVFSQPETNDTNQTPGLSVADELIKLKKLLDEGVLTQEEFDNEKKHILSIHKSHEPSTISRSEFQENSGNENKYRIMLYSVPQESKIQTIKAIRDYTGVSLSEGKSMTEDLPKTVAHNLNSEESDRMKQQLEVLRCEVIKEKE